MSSNTKVVGISPMIYSHAICKHNDKTRGHDPAPYRENIIVKAPTGVVGPGHVGCSNAGF